MEAIEFPNCININARTIHYLENQRKRKAENEGETGSSKVLQEKQKKLNDDLHSLATLPHSPSIQLPEHVSDYTTLFLLIFISFTSSLRERFVGRRNSWRK